MSITRSVVDKSVPTLFGQILEGITQVLSLRLRHNVSAGRQGREATNGGGAGGSGMHGGGGQLNLRSRHLTGRAGKPGAPTLGSRDLDGWVWSGGDERETGCKREQN